MKKKIILFLLVIIGILSITGCSKKENKNDNNNLKLVSNIEIGKKQYIEQLKKISINGTDDYLIITEKRKWEVPEHEDGTTVSFTITIPYTLHVNGVDYSAEYYLGDYQQQTKDNNPKYDLIITNLTNNYETEVLIKEK